jgi:hypothetical protein
MKKARWVSAAVGTAVLTAGFALPATAAFASGPDGDGGVLSVLSGNTVNAPVSLPVNVCGVAVTLLGGANAGCAGGAASNTVIAGGSGGGGNGNAGVASVGSGNNVNLPISAPVNVCGVSGAVGGFANSGCQGGAVSNTVIAGGSGGGGNGNAGVISALSGNTLNAPVSAPINVCGIAAAVVGFANGACVGGAASNTVIAGSSSGENGNAGTLSLLSGNTVNAPVSVPVNVCGIAAGIVGFANAACVGGATSTTIITPPPSTPPSMQPTPCLTTTPPPCQCTTAPPTSPPTTGTWSSTPPTTPPTTTPPTGNVPTSNVPTGNVPTGSGPTGSGPTGGGVTSSVLPASLPITGADLAGLAAVVVGSLGIGTTALVAARRRRRNNA